jgi:regulator of replication initiation timing
MASLLDIIQKIRDTQTDTSAAAIDTLETGIHDLYQQIETWNSRNMDEVDTLTQKNEEMFGEMHQLQVENSLLKQKLGSMQREAENEEEGIMLLTAEDYYRQVLARE